MTCLPHSTLHRNHARRPASRLGSCLVLATLSLLASGCVGLGGNIEGSFSCRAPKGDCAPSHVIDAAATAELGADPGPSHAIGRAADIEAARKRAGVGGDDASRTAERTIRIVFPAHVDEAGVLHDEAVAWAVVERPQWTGTLRAQDRGGSISMRAMRRRLRLSEVGGKIAAPGNAGAPDADLSAPLQSPTANADSDRLDPAGVNDGMDLHADLAAPGGTSPFHLASPPISSPEIASPEIASPLSFPSPVTEAKTGAPAPAAGGSGSPSYPKDRIPRHFRDLPHFPAAAAIEAARAKAAEAKAAKAKHEHSGALHQPAPAKAASAPPATKSETETM